MCGTRETDPSGRVLVPVAGEPQEALARSASTSRTVIDRRPVRTHPQERNLASAFVTASREAPHHSAISRCEIGASNGPVARGEPVVKIDQGSREPRGDVVGDQLGPLVHPAAEVAIGQQDRVDLVEGHDRRGMRAAVERRHLPEDLAGSRDRDQHLAAVRRRGEDARRPPQDQDHAIGEVSFEQERRAGGDAQGPAGVEQPPPIVLPELGEERARRIGRHQPTTR